LSATIILLAHGPQRDNLCRFVQEQESILSRYRLITSPDLATPLCDRLQTSVQTLASSSYAEIQKELEGGDVLAVIFLLDPSLDTEIGQGITALSRQCSELDIPLAFNLATAYPVINSFLQTRIGYLIFNPVAGRRDATEDLRIIRQNLYPWIHFHVKFTSREVDADQLTQDAIAHNPDLILAAGGDGTVSMVASQMINSPIPLGIIPRGTANALSVALGIPTNVVEACELILAGTTRHLDAARCNEHLMILLAGVGFEAEMVNKATREMKNQWGVLAYLIAGWNQLGQQELFDTNLEIDGDSYEFKAGALTVANTAPPTSVLAQGVGEVVFDDGLLDVTIITGQQVLQPTIRGKLRSTRYLAAMFGAALARTKADFPNLYHFRAKHLKIDTQPAQRIVVDGELVGTTPIAIQCIPSALTVFAPAKRKPSSAEQVATLWVRQVSPSISALMATLGAGSIIFSFVAMLLLRGIFQRLFRPQTKALEENILYAIHQFSSPALDQIMLVITTLQNTEVALPVFFITLALLWWRRNYREARMFAIACTGSFLLDNGMKLLFERPRPDLWEPLVETTNASFPSGHALNATVMYGFIAYFLALRFPKQTRWIYTGATVLVLAIGFSRLYLGVHWPSDVLGGWSLGFLWLIICIVILRLQDIRQRIKQQRQMISGSPAST
jgi:YegS/Rv2252/BmrU family lipid kinase